MAATTGGDFLVAWSSNLSFYGTTDFDGHVAAQRYNAPALPPPVPAMSSATRFALAAALMLLGGVYVIRRRA